MGIPSFYRWLVERYPRSVEDVIEASPHVINGVKVPIDSSQPNPNGIEFDNLYIDMNGIIHPCFHPEGQPAPKSYEEVFRNVFNYIDRMFSMIRPRKLLYMAIDGVAPRAKMNQQRARRFKAAKDAAAAADVFKSEGATLSALDSKDLDSNVITPGTEFMASLSSALQYYIHLRLNTDPGWCGVKVILSDASVVGEGEHKIMSYIRLQRNLPGFDPNTRHCLYGLDADLIMLALATHEIHFSILREDVSKVHQNTKNSKLGKGYMPKRQLDRNQELKLGQVGAEDYISRQKFQFFNVWILRDYLAHDMKIPNPTVKTDLERLLDDFVFMCLLVGNDFLPHVPSLEISEGGIDLLMTVYKKEFVQMGGYLTDSSKVNLKHVEHFLQALGVHEGAIFRRRSQVQKEKDKRFGKANGGVQSLRLSGKKSSKTFWSSVDLIPDSTLPSSSTFGAKESQSLMNSATPDGSNGTVDNIKLGEEGWKERYYAEKFEAMTDNERDKIRKHAVLKYIEGMCWVMHYYYEGVCSWQWFYPYHYAPFASDFLDLELSDIQFTPGKPFKPLDQLMAVLPAASAHALPSCYRELMTDSSSPILEFYPNDFELDMNGKRFEWQAICKLPFIKESQLLAEIAKVEHTLTDEERRRNSLGMDILFLHVSHPLAGEILIFYGRNKDHPKLAKAKVKREIDPKFSGGMNGFMYISDRPVWPPEICSSICDMEKITMNKVISVFYKYPTSHPHIPRPPEGIVIPRTLVKKEDILPVLGMWHDTSAVRARVDSKKPVPKSISGSSLAKLAHQLVSKYYVAQRKENVDPGILDGLVDTDYPYRAIQTNVTEPEKKGLDSVVTKTSKKRKRNRKADCLRKQVTGKASVPGHMASNIPSCQTQQVSEEQVHEKKMYDSSCPNVTEPEKKTPDTAVTNTPNKGNLKRKAAVLRKQATGEASVPGHMTLNVPSCQTPQISEQVLEKNMYNMSCPNVTKPETTEPKTALTKTSKRQKWLLRKADVRRMQANKRSSVLEHSALNVPSCPAQQVSEEQVHEKNIDNERRVNVTIQKSKCDTTDIILDKRKLDDGSSSNDGHIKIEAAVHDGHIKIDASSLASEPVLEEILHEKQNGC